MKVEFELNIEGENVLQLCGITPERFEVMRVDMSAALHKLTEDDDYDTQHLIRDFLAIHETPGELIFLAFQAGRKTEEFSHSPVAILGQIGAMLNKENQ